jgi:hypothetical protein
MLNALICILCLHGRAPTASAVAQLLRKGLRPLLPKWHAAKDRRTAAGDPRGLHVGRVVDSKKCCRSM